MDKIDWYEDIELREMDANPDPIEQFKIWFEQANTHIPEANAMTLATATPDGCPSARTVLLKGFDERGFVFFTNYDSQKSKDLDVNAQASLVFWWKEHQRQVRIDGTVETVSVEESDEYFHTRPRGSRLGAWASPQSKVISSREILEERYEEYERQYPQDVPRPRNWGGYRVVPRSIEFWQGRSNRLHDRLRYRREGKIWHLERLAP